MARLVKLGFLVAALATSPLAAAQWYGDISVGGTSKNISTSNFAVTGATAYSITQDDNGAGFKIQGGYQITPNLGIEVGYVNLGRIGATNQVSLPAAGAYGVKAKAEGWNAVVAGTFPLMHGFSLIGKLGTIYSITSTAAESSGAVVISGNTSWKKSEANWAYGLGAEYDINRRLSLRGEWERFDGFRITNDSDSNNINLYSVGLKLMF